MRRSFVFLRAEHRLNALQGGAITRRAFPASLYVVRQLFRGRRVGRGDGGERRVREAPTVERKPPKRWQDFVSAAFDKGYNGSQ